MIGQIISHYKIVEKLGEGGMGVVYKAEDTKLDRIVALKFLPPNLTTNDTDKARFIQEAKAAAAINHPNICTIYDIQEHDNQQFIVMEYVEGRTLREEIPLPASQDPPLSKGDSGGLVLEKAIDYATQIAEALKAAHEKGIVHRDIKSENIMVTETGQIKVMDFGLAKLRGSAKLTKTTSTAGTLSYSSPEQIQGQEVDGRSDIFSFGVVLYEMLSGELPFKGEYESAVMYSILNEEPRTVSEFRKELPKDLVAVINKCLQKEPKSRFNNLSEVLDILNKVNRQSMKKENDLTPAKSRSVLTWLAPVAGIVILTLILWMSGIFRVKEKKKEIDSIAVLPLANLSGNLDKEYFSDGMTEALITELSKIRALNVISRTSVMRYKNAEKSLPQIGKELNVDAVVEGSAMLVGNRVRISTQLIETATDHHLWSNDYERDLKDILSLQKEVARAIASEINITLTQDEQKRLQTTQTVNPRAQELYLIGRYHINKLTPEGARNAIQYFQQALEIDDQYALAYTGIADAYDILIFLGGIDLREGLKMVRGYAEKALAIDPTIGDAYALFILRQFSG